MHIKVHSLSCYDYEMLIIMMMIMMLKRGRSMTLPGNLHIYRICLLCIQRQLPPPAAGWVLVLVRELLNAAKWVIVIVIFYTHSYYD